MPREYRPMARTPAVAIERSSNALRDLSEARR
jgi:hypothetical protein